MARALTGNEPTLLASHGQHSRVYMAVKPMTVVYRARVDQTVLSTDMINAITFVEVSGTLGLVLPGMLMLVGSSPDGSEKGFVRIRSTPSATVFYIGETSEIAFEDEDYLTVINDFPLLDKPVNTDSGVTCIDSEILYVDQHKYMAPVPIMGPLVAVAELVEASVSLTLTPGASYCLGSSISASWSATGPAAVTITNGTTASPTLAFTVAGWYRIKLIVTGANTKTATGYRWVLVWDQDNAPALLSQQAAVDSPTGDADSGVWEFNATLWDHADLANVAECALVVLFAEDWYGDTKQSIGPIPGWENVIACGWIAGETIDWNPRAGSVKFTVRGPAWWLQQIDTQVVTIKNVNNADPTTWDQIEDLDVDKALWHVAHWRSTITSMIDIFLPGDTTPVQSLDGGLGSIWDALRSIARRVGAAPICDRYGRIFIQIDPQLMPYPRSTIPIVMDVSKSNWKDSVQLERRVIKSTSIVELNALSFNGTISTQLWSRAPGNLSGAYGRSEPVDGYIIVDQASANELAGMILAQRNNPHPVVPLKIAANNRMIDIAPLQYLTQSIASGDTKRGITWSTRKLIPRRIQLVINSKTGSIYPEIEAEAETGGGIGDTVGVTYIPPAIVTPNIPGVPTLPTFPLIPPGTIDFPGIVPIVDPPVILECANDWYAPRNEYALAFSQNHVAVGESIIAALPCTLRDEDVYNGPSYLQISALWDGNALNNAVVTGTNGGSDVATATLRTAGLGTFVFHLPNAVAVTGFKIAIPTGNTFTKGDVLNSGSTQGGNYYGQEITGLTPGNWYCIENTGTPPHDTFPQSEVPNYMYYLSNSNSPIMNGGSQPNCANVYVGTPGWVISNIAVGNYRRCFFKATTPSIFISYAGTIGNPDDWVSIVGTLSWILSEAFVDGARSIAAVIHNICA